jgi:hypothetical protein
LSGDGGKIRVAAALPFLSAASPPPAERALCSSDEQRAAWPHLRYIDAAYGNGSGARSASTFRNYRKNCAQPPRTDIGATRLSDMGHITADDTIWLVSIAILAVLSWSVAFLVLAVRPGNSRGARQRKADRQAASRAKGYGKQKRALSPLAFVAMVFPSLIVIIWHALPRYVRRQALGAATDNAIGIGREVRALTRRLIRR